MWTTFWTGFRFIIVEFFVGFWSAAGCGLPSVAPPGRPPPPGKPNIENQTNTAKTNVVGFLKHEQNPLFQNLVCANKADGRRELGLRKKSAGSAVSKWSLELMKKSQHQKTVVPSVRRPKLKKEYLSSSFD